jgi:hypothetical protein
MKGKVTVNHGQSVYFVRKERDKGREDSPCSLPSFPGLEILHHVRDDELEEAVLVRRRSSCTTQKKNAEGAHEIHAYQVPESGRKHMYS